MESRQTVYLRIILVTAIVILVNLMAQQYSIRLDFTEDRRYSLSQASRDVIDQLEGPVTFRGFFSEDLPPALMQTRNDLRDLIVEYHEHSNGLIAYEFTNPQQDDETEQMVVDRGVDPKYLMVRERDEARERRVYMGAVLETAAETVTIPFIGENTPLEYEVTRHLKRLVSEQQPVVGVLNAFGSANKADMEEVVRELELHYDVQDISAEALNNNNPPDAVMFVQPEDSMPQEFPEQLESYLENGGNLFLAYAPVWPQLLRYRVGKLETGFEKWLEDQGISLGPLLLYDANCGSINIPQQWGQRESPAYISFPYYPVIINFEDHITTTGLESVFMPWTSFVELDGDKFKDADWRYILRTSEESGVNEVPFELDFQYQWRERDFNQRFLPAAAAVDKHRRGGSRMMITGSGHFLLSEYGAGQSPDNLNFAQNTIDWLAGTTDLVELRTRTITDRPVRSLPDQTVLLIKYGNVLLPVVLALLTGLVSAVKQQRKRKIWKRF